jgi:hypothetical protein
MKSLPNSTELLIIPPVQIWGTDYISQREIQDGPRELTLDENWILLPDPTACLEKGSTDNSISKRHIYQAIILIFACVSCDGEIRTACIETVGLRSGLFVSVIQYSRSNRY